MICKNCGQEIPNDSVFCTHCGAACEQNSADSASQPNEQQTISDQTYVQQPPETVPPKKKGKGPKIKLIAILAVIVIVVAGVGTLAYNSQPVLSRLFNGEKEHLTMLIDRLEEKYTSGGSSSSSITKAKITQNISYDLKQLKDMGLSLENIENSEFSLSQIMRIDSDKNLFKFDQEWSLMGTELPTVSTAINSSGDIGIYIESLTKNYVSYMGLLSMYLENSQTSQSEDQLLAVYSSISQLQELLPLLEKYKDNMIDTALNSGEVAYESNNDDLGFNTYYYEITLTPETICDIMQSLIETLNADDQLKLELCELISPDNAQEMLEQLNTSLSELLDELGQNRDSLIQEMEVQLEEIKIELWFDGRNTPLGTALAINLPDDDGINQDFEITILDYKHNRDMRTLISLEVGGETMFELSNEAEISGSRKQGSFDLELNQIKLLEGEYDLTSYTVQGMELYEGTADYKLSIETDSSTAVEFNLECTMERLDNGMNMEIAPSVNSSGYNVASTIDFGEISYGITVEPLDEEIEDINIVEITEENYTENLTPDEFSAKLEEFALNLQTLLEGIIPSSDSSIF